MALALAANYATTALASRGTVTGLVLFFAEPGFLSWLTG
jgi:hypothetical protein